MASRTLGLVAGILVSGMAVLPPGAAEAQDFRSHHLMLKKTGDVRSLFYSTSNSAGAAITGCVERLPDSSGWVDGQRNFRNGEQATLITFTSWNCTDGYVKRRDLVVPGDDGLANWWVDMT